MMTITAVRVRVDRKLLGYRALVSHIVSDVCIRDSGIRRQMLSSDLRSDLIFTRYQQIAAIRLLLPTDTPKSNKRSNPVPLDPSEAL